MFTGSGVVTWLTGLWTTFTEVNFLISRNPLKTFGVGGGGAVRWSDRFQFSFLQQSPGYEKCYKGKLLVVFEVDQNY